MVVVVAVKSSRCRPPRPPGARQALVVGGGGVSAAGAQLCPAIRLVLLDRGHLLLLVRHGQPALPLGAGQRRGAWGSSA